MSYSGIVIEGPLGGGELVVFWSEDYVVAGIGFETTVKSKDVAESLLQQPIAGVRVVAPRPATVAEVTAVHDPDYVRALEEGDPSGLAASNGIGWDPGLLDGVLASTGGVRDAVLLALAERVHTGSLSSGLHHARFGEGAGFCTINGIVVAARAALAAGARRVLIVDFDAHCGGGTASLIEDLSGVEQIDVSVVPYDFYSSRDGARLTLADADECLDACRLALAGVRNPEEIDVVIYNAGMDPHEGAGGLIGITTDVLAEREGLFFDWAEEHGLPVAFVLAGGYLQGVGLDELVGLHRLTIRQAAAVMQTPTAAA